jgi:hypothetical protein
VVIACPLEHAGLTFGGSLSAHMPKPRPWTTTHVTFVQGKLSSAYFGTADVADFGDVLALRDVQDFSSLGLQFVDLPSPRPHHKLYKVSVRTSLSARLVHACGPPCPCGGGPPYVT